MSTKGLLRGEAFYDETDFLPEALPKEALADHSLRLSRWSLRFVDPEAEQAYINYRNATVRKWLPKLTVLVAGIVLFGVLLDLLIFAEDEPIWPIVAARLAIAAGMLSAAAWLHLGGQAERLQFWIVLGVSLIHLAWLVATPAMHGHFNEYLGILPVNMLITFIVSGLMFHYARWVGLIAAFAYGGTIATFYDGQPYGPIFYLMVLTIYAAYASYVAERARREAWHLLQNVLPPCIADRMQGGERLIADQHDDACVLFADIAGFTRMSERMTPDQLVALLDEIFTQFDRITEDLDLEKIKTMGDCYMMVSGLPETRPRDPERIALAALRMQRAVEKISEREGGGLKIRAGIHTGPVVAGVIGKRKFIYDLWGDTVNTASRLEGKAPPGEVYVSAQLNDELGGEFETTNVGAMKLKGKVAEMEIWHLRGHKTGRF
ncbi:MAG: adenylate/guanylate cyclase domain-containing protein [Pseudomonadota bacterium]